MKRPWTNSGWISRIFTTDATRTKRRKERIALRRIELERFKHCAEYSRMYNGFTGEPIPLPGRWRLKMKELNK